MAVVIMIPPCVHCSIAGATMNFTLLTFQALKNKIMLLVLMLLELYCPGKPWGIGEEEGGSVSLQCKGRILSAFS